MNQVLELPPPCVPKIHEPLETNVATYEQELAFQSELVEELRRLAFRDASRMSELLQEAHTLAELWLVKGAFHQAEALYRRILYRLLDAPMMDGELILGISSRLAELQVRWGEPEGGRDLYEKAAELAARLGIRSSRALGVVKNNMGMICKRQGDFKKAAECYEAALSAFYTESGEFSSEMADVVDNLGALSYRSLELEGALDHHQRALALRPSSDVMGTIRTLRHLARSQRALGQFVEAEASRLQGQELKSGEACLVPIPPSASVLLAVDDPDEE